jgi:hypothetical protein
MRVNFIKITDSNHDCSQSPSDIQATVASAFRAGLLFNMIRSQKIGWRFIEDMAEGRWLRFVAPEKRPRRIHDCKSIHFKPGLRAGAMPGQAT